MAVKSAAQALAGADPLNDHAAMQRNWRSILHLSSIGRQIDRLLGNSAFDRGPWLVVIFASGIAAWFLLPAPWQWSAAIGLGLLLSIFGFSLHSADGNRAGDDAGDGMGVGGSPAYPHLRMALITMGLVFAAGVAVIWIRSETIGAPAIERAWVGVVEGYVLEREDQPAQDRIRVTLAIRDARAGIARKIRVNLPGEKASPQIAEGAILRMKIRLLPPAPPMLPGSYNFARTAWFSGLSATGSAIGAVEVVQPSTNENFIAALQRSLSSHVQGRVSGSAGTIAAAFASGDRGSIEMADEDAMRDAGLTHLLSISGLHVSAIIAGAYILTLKLLGLWGWVALRLRLPLIAAGAGAAAGVFYTLLTGSEVPTIRSCAAAILVLIALALGRDALSLRMVAVAAFCVLLFWPESLTGPSFQMSFAAVLAIVALHNARPVKAFLAPDGAGVGRRIFKRGIMLLITGLVIEIALLPIVLFHFHRAGLYGALANVIAIPLVTFISMPLIALALLLDLMGLGGPIWWMVEQSLNLLLWIAHFTASQPGAVKLMPQMGHLTFALFVTGGLWLALWHGRRRFLGLIAAGMATIMPINTPVPDILISRDGRHVGVVTDNGQLLSLRQAKSTYAADNLMELSSVKGQMIAMADWPDASCSREFCTMSVIKDQRIWHLLMARNRQLVEERSLAAACERADIVVADRYLPASCRPKWLKADRALLDRTGGLAINLKQREIESTADVEGEHGWWRAAGN